MLRSQSIDKEVLYSHSRVLGKKDAGLKGRKGGKGKDEQVGKAIYW